MSKVVVEDIQKARKPCGGKQIQLYIENQALSQKSSQFKSEKTWLCTDLCMFQHLNCMHWATIPVTDIMTEWQTDRNTNWLPYAFAVHVHRGIIILIEWLQVQFSINSTSNWHKLHEARSQV